MLASILGLSFVYTQSSFLYTSMQDRFVSASAANVVSRVVSRGAARFSVSVVACSVSILFLYTMCHGASVWIDSALKIRVPSLLPLMFLRSLVPIAMLMMTSALIQR